MTIESRGTSNDSESQSQDSGSTGQKRKHNEAELDEEPQPLPAQPQLPEFKLVGGKSSSRDAPPIEQKSSSQEGWQKVEGRSKKKAKKIPKQHSSNYPAIQFSSKECRLQSQIKISDLQNLVLYILADGPSPQFVSVRHRLEIRKVVVLMVPGLEMSMFESKARDGDLEDLKRDDRDYRSPDDFYPMTLRSDRLHDSLQPFADMFEHIWPVKTPGDDKYAKMHSPLHAMLTAPMQKSKEDKSWNKNSRKGATPAKEPQGWKNSRVPIPELVHSIEELLENEYTLHPALYDNEIEKDSLAEFRRSNGVSVDHGWVDTNVTSFEEGTPPDSEIEAGSITAGREVLAMDCEMCMTGKEFELTRISIVGWDGSKVLDELVKPDKPITNYLTQYSGITEEMLAPVTTSLADIQKKLLEILHPRTILIGHSLNSDLNALKITHPYIIDTAIIYPHPRGPPLKSALKYLAQKYLNREIQKGHGTTGPGAGHDSIEDARTCLDLVKQKCEKGKQWGTSDAQGENIFKRVARTGVRYKNQGGSAVPSPLNGKSSSMIDWGEPKKGPGAASNFPIGCHSDEEVMRGVLRAVKGDSDGKEIPGGGVDFVWARFRELEALKGWWNNNKQVAAVAAAVDLSLPAKAVTTVTDGKSEVADNNADIVVQSTLNGLPNEATKAVDTTLVDHTHPVETKDEKHTSNTLSMPAPPISEHPPTPTTAPTTVPSPTSLPPPVSSLSKSVSTATSELASRIHTIYNSLPPCTALVIYSGSGDPREMSRLQAMQTTFKREYKIKKWDQLSVKWTDTEEQALKRAVRRARDGIAFVTVK